MKSASFIFLLSTFIFSSNLHAKDKNQFMYFGLSAKNHNYSDLNFAPTVSKQSLGQLKLEESNKAIGARLLSGYQFNRYLAVELGITNFGEGDFKLFEQTTSSDGKKKTNTLHKGEFKTIGADISIVATYPFSDSIFVKALVGLQGWDNQFDMLEKGNDSFNVISQDDRGASLLTGFGIGYGVSKSMAFTLDFEQTEIAEIKTNSVSINWLFRF